jgi:hypothetical protein
MKSFHDLKSRNCTIPDLQRFANGIKIYSDLPISPTSSTRHSSVMPRNSFQMVIDYGERICMGPTSWSFTQSVESISYKMSMITLDIADSMRLVQHYCSDSGGQICMKTWFGSFGLATSVRSSRHRRFAYPRLSHHQPHCLRKSTLIPCICLCLGASDILFKEDVRCANTPSFGCYERRMQRHWRNGYSKI